MSLKKNLEASLDIIMACLLLFLLSYPLTRGLWRHGVSGLVLIALFLLHHGLNPRWYGNFFKRRLSLKGALIHSFDILLFIDFLAVFLSSLLLFGEIFAFAPFPMVWWARSLHNCATAWLFILASIHVGFHWRTPWNRGRAKFGALWPFLAVAVFLTALYFSRSSGLAENLFLLESGENFPGTPELFLIQYLTMAAGFYLAANLAAGFKWIKK